MSKLRVHGLSISIDGYGAGPGHDLENPLGVGGLKVFDWFFPTRTWQRMQGNADGETGVDKENQDRGQSCDFAILERRLRDHSRSRLTENRKSQA